MVETEDGGIFLSRMAQARRERDANVTTLNQDKNTSYVSSSFPVANTVTADENSKGPDMSQESVWTKSLDDQLDSLVRGCLFNFVKVAKKMTKVAKREV